MFKYVYRCKFRIVSFGPEVSPEIAGMFKGPHVSEFGVEHTSPFTLEDLNLAQFDAATALHLPWPGTEIEILERTLTPETEAKQNV